MLSFGCFLEIMYKQVKSNHALGSTCDGQDHELAEAIPMENQLLNMLRRPLS